MSKPVAFVAITYAFTIAMMGTTMPTPVYSLYQAEFGFSVFVVTVIFAAYALGVLAALLAFGRWSDSLGRRPLLLAGIALGIASALVFVFAGSLAALLVGRVLSGLSAGIFVGTATVTLVELAPAPRPGPEGSSASTWKSRAPAIATAANIGGLGLGPLVAGLLVEYLPEPTQLTFVVNLVLLAVAGVAVFLVPEPVTVLPGARPHMQRLSVPGPVRATFVRASIGGFAGFAVLGLFTGVSPGFVTQILGVQNHAVVGAVVFVTFASSAAAQIALRGLDTTVALRGGCVTLIVGVGVGALCLALATASLPVLLVAAVVCGIGQGITFSKGLASVTEELPPDRRAEVTSTLFVVLYIAISVPVIGAGAAATAWGLVTAGVVFSAAVAALAVVSLILLFGRTTANQEPSESEKS
ncbi:MFS transporter [Rhodococcus sp. 06-156-3C]|uniref:MFS transporter n=1 Tax=Nocardiaceae TaxID=85025 RepID=UPI000522F9AB|nr:MULTISPECIES: MFS transporter [Rhodococcus]OZD14216.1 MFS transporter [Rhodococcus sp. 06-156-3C]OZD15907.1 MFS transporter [Rhodococcus sp. 06-156-4C]OZD24552.1 MFS transporter [Rhodococcus sp. 06-156-3b]OZD28507.1 MFS transporter [Rhodococcus sp. 06-156-4a]OZD36833.1 MFS transporter [Rhodococcus sp. 06-156-3]